MKKLSLTMIGLIVYVSHLFAQFSNAQNLEFKAKKLSLQEINLVNSYYTQTGGHSAITGGLGNEKVTDLMNGIELKWVGYDDWGRKHTLSTELGIDHHTAASAAFVSKTGASSTTGTRVYPSLNWTQENTERKQSFGLGIYLSGEYNYKSLGLDIHGSKGFNENTELQWKASAFFDKVKQIYPSELIPARTTTTVVTSASRGGGSVTSILGGNDGIPSNPRNTFNLSLSLSQVINQRMQASISFDPTTQNGYLGLPFHRVYTSDGSVHVENLPSTRTKLPIGLRLNYFADDHIIIRGFYRFYTDDWGIQSQTADIEVPIKFNAFLSLSPFFRYYVQTAAKYFAPYGMHKVSENYYTSNYAYSAFESEFIGSGLRASPPSGVLHIKQFSSIELRYGHYLQNTGLQSDVISFHFTFK